MRTRNDYLRRLDIATKYDTSYLTSINLINEMEGKLAMIRQFQQPVNTQKTRPKKQGLHVKVYGVKRTHKILQKRTGK